MRVRGLSRDGILGNSWKRAFPRIFLTPTGVCCTPGLLRGRSDLRHEEGGDTEVPKQVGKGLLKGGIVLYSWETGACGKRLAGPNNCS